jgi:hypothetical protein
LPYVTIKGFHAVVVKIVVIWVVISCSFFVESDDSEENAAFHELHEGKEENIPLQ